MALTKPILISKITEAFKEVKLEDGIGLSEADAIDNYSSAEVRAGCRQNDEKLNWALISSDDLNQYYTSLSFFDAKGMQFHLPAFMIAEIKGEYRFGMSFVLTHLSDYSRSQFALLNKEQRAAVRCFLEFLKEGDNYEYERPEIKRAIEDYWSK